MFKKNENILHRHHRRRFSVECVLQLLPKSPWWRSRFWKKFKHNNNAAAAAAVFTSSRKKTKSTNLYKIHIGERANKYGIKRRWRRVVVVVVVSCETQLCVFVYSNVERKKQLQR